MTDERRETAERLKGWAIEEGFSRAGIASLEPSEYADAYRRWLERGDHAGMAWMGRRVEVRLDPASRLEGARSALCVALQYHPLGSAEPAGDLWPKVARYARGDDYHDVMGARLDRLAERIRAAYPGCLARPYVDTGPLLERELAQRAGLGTFGKHTNLLDREHGSYFLLGELLLTLELAPDEPIGDVCGRCTRCLDACPTGALPEPYRLDASRCISYWTIEHRGDLPEAVRDGLEGWVFGCDVCQEVCPHNQKLDPATEERLDLPRHRAGLDLVALLAMNREEYVERFRGSPMKRAKLGGLKRNAAVAMGNRGDGRYVAALERVLRSESDPVVRRHAAWALGKIGTPEAGGALDSARATEADPEVRREIARAQGRC